MQEKTITELELTSQEYLEEIAGSDAIASGLSSVADGFDSILDLLVAFFFLIRIGTFMPCEELEDASAKIAKCQRGREVLAYAKPFVKELYNSEETMASSLKTLLKRIKEGRNANDIEAHLNTYREFAKFVLFESFDGGAETVVNILKPVLTSYQNERELRAISQDPYGAQNEFLQEVLKARQDVRNLPEGQRKSTLKQMLDNRQKEREKSQR